MALVIPSSSSSLLSKKPNLLLLLHSPAKPTTQFFTIRSQEPTQSSKPTTVTQPIDDPSPRKPTSTALGFGSSSSSSPKLKANPVSSATKKVKDGGRRGRASVIRRTPVEKPNFLPEKREDGGESSDKLEYENGFLLTWLGLGLIIFVEGIALSASGFLPEEWDKFLVKYLYPSFTPTVFLFVAGTAGYGVLKYLQNDKLKKQ